jgi:hypothetical protein
MNWSSFKKEECKQMYIYESAQPLENGQPSIADMIAEVATSKSGATLYSAAALRQVCRDVITGEGTTVVGRVHFSRTIDDYDAALCALILLLAGRAGAPVSRAEADAMFDIGAMARDRRDRDRFDDLLVKAVVHHVMAASSYDVPHREIALAPLTSVNRWALPIKINTEVRSWLEKRLRDVGPGSAAARAIAKIIGIETPTELSVADIFDIAA